MQDPRASRLARLVLLVGLVGLSPARADDDLASQLPRIAPTEPAKAQSMLKVHAGFRANLAAHEPLVADPVNVCYDAEGRLYVVEMRGYPFPEKAPTGKIRRLEDTDGDGVFDRGTDFLTGLNWPTGVLLHDGGVFVCAAPDLFYAKDADGDGVAEIKRVVFTGFGTQNVQQLFNGLARGLDGWIYGAVANNGGEIRSPERPDMKPVLLRGRDFRFKPDGSAFEAISGGGQFGNVFDDWGHRFVCNNRLHARQIVLPAHYLARNPDVTVAGVIADIASDGNEAAVYRVSPPEPWRVVRSKQYETKMKTDLVFARRLAPAERHPAGFFSSASGLTLYRGAAFPAEYRGNVFVCDVAGNLVHRKTLTPAGAIFRADRAESGVKAEFLASPDIWFRPVNLANTPNGTLLVLDMYRETIEHPLSIPDDIKAHLDLTSGKTRGRIYEVVPESYQRPSLATLAGATTEMLIQELASHHAWRRETAQRLLVERNDPSCVEALTSAVKKSEVPLARLHALWTLENLGKLDAALVALALKDPVSGIRENAARMAEPRLNDHPELAKGVLALADDPDAMVRFQAALSLSDLDGRTEEVVSALKTIAQRDPNDRWTRTAVLLASRGKLIELVKALDETPGFFGSGPGRVWLEELAAVAGASRTPAASETVLATYTRPETDPALARSVLIGLSRGLPRSGRKPEALFGGKNAARLLPLLEKAAARAQDTNRPVAERVEAIRLLTVGPEAKTLDGVSGLLDAQQPPEVQIEALRVLGGLSDPAVGPTVLERWQSLSPNVRREAAEVLLARPDRVEKLLAAMESGSLKPSELDALRRQQLTELPRPDLRERATKLLAADKGSDRGGVVASYLKTLELQGDRSRGRQVFLKVCATCHRAGGEGSDVGPNFSTVAAKPPAELLVHVLDPNREVAPNFVNYTVATTDGRVVSGIVAEETVVALTLKRAEGVIEVLPRNRVEAVRATGLSLMPEGLEKSVSAQDLADVFAFIRGLGTDATPATR
ncbi:MAG: PVC-type heme-binding CxxCH protein [Isosphaeraceae bacterium]